MARAVKRKRVGRSPQEMGEIRSGAFVRDATWGSKMEYIHSIGEGAEVTPPRILTIDFDKEKEVVQDLVGAIVSVLQEDTRHPCPGTVVKVKGLLALAEDCFNQTKGPLEVRKAFSTIKRMLKNLDRKIMNVYTYDAPSDQWQILLLSFILDLGDATNFDVVGYIKG